MKQRNFTHDEILLVQRTYEMLAPLADTFALFFYDRFFALAPEVRPLFITDMELQREKLMASIAFIVRGLDKPDMFIEELREMGLRHASYRVEPAHYSVMQEAFLLALEECLGKKLTNEMRAAWQKMLTFVSKVMLAGAAEPV